MKTFMWRFKGSEIISYQTAKTYKKFIETKTKQYGLEEDHFEVIGYINDNGVWVYEQKLIEMCKRGEI